MGFRWNQLSATEKFKDHMGNLLYFLWNFGSSFCVKYHNCNIGRKIY